MNTDAFLAGNLKLLNLGDVLQLLGSSGVTGVLRIMSRYAPEPGLIYLNKGNPIHAVCAEKTGMEALLTLFGWIEGEFEFRDEIVTSMKTITKSRMEIILEGLRMLDDGQTPKLGPDSYRKYGTDSAEYMIEGPIIRGPLVNYMDVIDEDEFEDGMYIVNEKSYGNWIWVIMEGLVDVVKEIPHGQVKILTLSRGSFIGSIQGFKMESHVRNVTTIAKGRVHLGVLDTRRLASEFSSFPWIFKDFFTSLDQRLRQVTNICVDIYQKKNILDTYIKDKQIVIKQGENDEKLFGVTEGNAFVVRETDHGYVPLAHLRKGDFFGSVPFLNLGHEPLGASIFAVKDDLQFIPMDSEFLQNEYKKLSTSFKNIIFNLSTCVSAITDVACEFSKRVSEEN